MEQDTGQLNGIFQALADPTRRAVLGRLSSGPASVSDLAKPFDMALPSFMQHIRFLEESGWIRTRKVGACGSAPSRRSRLLPSNVAVRATRHLGRPHRPARAVCRDHPRGGNAGMIAIGKPGTRPDDIARHQGAPGGRSGAPGRTPRASSSGGFRRRPGARFWKWTSAPAARSRPRSARTAASSCRT